MGKICLVTGGAGFIGSHLAKKLIERGHKVFIIDDLSTGFLKNIPENAVFCKADVSKEGELKKIKLPGKIDYVFHLAAQSSGEASFDDPLHDIDANYRATYNMLEFASAHQCRRFIFSSSMSVYGGVPADKSKINESYPCNPESYYGCNKLASEKIIALFAKQAGINYTIFRLFNVYGPGQNMRNMKQGMASIYLSYICKNQPIIVKGQLKRFRDFIYIDDVMQVFLRSMNNARTYGEIFNVGTSLKTTVKNLLNLILRLYKKESFQQWVRLDNPTKGDISGIIADTTKLKNVLSWKPEYSLKTGLKQMKDWLDNNNA